MTGKDIFDIVWAKNWKLLVTKVCLIKYKVLKTGGHPSSGRTFKILQSQKTYKEIITNWKSLRKCEK